MTFSYNTHFSFIVNNNIITKPSSYYHNVNGYIQYWEFPPAPKPEGFPQGSDWGAYAVHSNKKMDRTRIWLYNLANM